MVNLIPWKQRRRTDDGGKLTRSTQPLTQLQDEMNSLFDRFFQGGSAFEQFWNSWPAAVEDEWPNRWALDVDDREKELVIRAEAPGFDPDQFDVQMRGNHLLIRAEHKEEEKKENAFSYSYGSFQRVIPLPEGIAEEGIDAHYHNGVLEVKLPKAEGAERKRITVKTS